MVQKSLEMVVGPVGRTAVRYSYKKIGIGLYRRKNENWPNQKIIVSSDGSWKHVSPFNSGRVLVREGKGADALNHQLTLWHERH